MKKPRKLTQPSEFYGVGPAAASLPLVHAYNDARKHVSLEQMVAFNTLRRSWTHELWMHLQARKPPPGWGAAACCPMVCR